MRLPADLMRRCRSETATAASNAAKGATAARQRVHRPCNGQLFLWVFSVRSLTRSQPATSGAGLQADRPGGKASHVTYRRQVWPSRVVSPIQPRVLHRLRRPVHYRACRPPAANRPRQRDSASRSSRAALGFSRTPRGGAGPSAITVSRSPFAQAVKGPLLGPSSRRETAAGLLIQHDIRFRAIGRGSPRGAPGDRQRRRVTADRLTIRYFRATRLFLEVGSPYQLRRGRPHISGWGTTAHHCRDPRSIHGPTPRRQRGLHRPGQISSGTLSICRSSPVCPASFRHLDCWRIPAARGRCRRGLLTRRQATAVKGGVHPVRDLGGRRLDGRARNRPPRQDLARGRCGRSRPRGLIRPARQSATTVCRLAGDVVDVEYRQDAAGAGAVRMIRSKCAAPLNRRLAWGRPDGLNRHGTRPAWCRRTQDGEWTDRSTRGRIQRLADR